MKPIELDPNWQHLSSFTILDDELDFETLHGPIVHPQPRAKSGHRSLGKKRFVRNEK
jgi:hypothetical protein